MDNDPKMASKPAQVKEKIVMGKMNKFYEENCLLQQAFVKDGSMSVEQYMASAAKALGGKVYTMYEISTMIRQAYSSLAKKTELEIVQELASVPMLFIDEMGRSKGSKAEQDWLSYILDKRHQRKLPFMLGTNSHLMRDCPHGKQHCEQCFENFLGNDILSRLGQDSEIVTMYDAPDYRRRK